LRSLFCLSSNSFTGANQDLLNFAAGLQKLGQQTEVVVWQNQGELEWFQPGVVPLATGSFEEVLKSGHYDFVFFSSLFLAPLIIPHAGNARVVLYYQGHEGFLHGDSFDEAATEKAALNDLLKLPDAIISISHSVCKILETRYGIHSSVVSP